MRQKLCKVVKSINILLISLLIFFSAISIFIINEKNKVTVKIAKIDKAAFILVDGKDYVRKEDTVTLTIEGADTNYLSNSLVANNIIVKVNGSVITPTTKVLSAPSNIVNGIKYELTLSGITGNGELSVEIQSNTIQDKAGNKNNLTSYNTGIIIDNVIPTCVVTANPSENPTATTSIIYTFTFSEDVVGFGEDDIIVGNGTKGSFTQVNKKTYTLVVTNSQTATQTITVLAGKLTDLVGNANIAISKTVAIDRTAPTVVFGTNGSTTYKKSQSTTVTVTDIGSAGVNLGTLKYQWTQNAVAPTEASFTTAFTNGGNITKNDGTGNNWYLWILAKDNLGNTTIKNSGVFYLDNINPTNTAPTGTATSNTITVAFKQTDLNSGINSASKQYAIKKTGDTAWGTYVTDSALVHTFTNLIKNISYDIKTKVTDNAGNTIESSILTIKTEELDKPAIIIAPTNWTKGDVTATISYPDLSYVSKQYSYDGTNWTDTTVNPATLTITENKTIYARIKDSTNQVSGTATLSVTNIDKVAPIIEASNSIYGQTLVATLKDNESKVKYWQVTTTNTTPTSGWETISETNSVSVSKQGLNSGTYYIWVKDTAGNINSKEIFVERAKTATAAAANKTYTGVSQTGITGANVTWSNASTGIDAGTYKALATPTANYAWSDGTFAAKEITWTMNKKSVAVTWGAVVSFVYNGGAQAPTAAATSGVAGETINITRTTGTNAGSYTSTASVISVTGGRAKADNYILTGNTKAYTITRAKTATAAAANKTYNGASQTGVTGANVTWSNASTGIDAGTYKALATPTANYAWSDGTFAAKEITWTMTAKTVAVSWSQTTKIYNGSVQAPTAAAISGVANETINLAAVTGGGTNVGSHTANVAMASVTGGRAKVANYNLTGTSTTITITRLATATAAAANKTYTGASQTGVSGNFVTWSNASTGIDAGTYKALATPTANYAWSDGTFAAKEITWTMNKKSIAVTWGAVVSFVYNGGAQAPTAAATSGVTGETINITRTTGTNVGSYTSTASGISVTGGRAKIDNYILTGNTKAYTITRAKTATAAAANKTYTGVSQTGITGANVTWSNASTGIDAGIYKALATPTANYAWSDGTFAAKEITWTMNKKSIAVTWGAVVSFVYNGGAQAPTAAATSGVTGETINITRTTGTNAGSYTSTASVISVTGGRAKADNYILTGNTKAYTITKAERTITMNTTAVITFGTNGSLAFTYTGEDVNATVASSNTALATMQVVDTVNAGTITLVPVSAGTAVATLTVPASTNYNAKTATSTITINRKNTPLTLNLSSYWIKNGAVGTVSYSYGGNGAVSATSSNTGVATIAGVNTTSKIVTINPISDGGEVIITVSAAQTGQYNAVQATTKLMVDRTLPVWSQVDTSVVVKDEIFAPVLGSGMTPIKWNGTTEVETTASDPNWYNYETNNWANAKTADGSYWVWIPRYEYKILSGEGTITAGEIDVKFIPTSKTTPTAGYKIHPAFENGSATGKNNNYMNGEWDKELSGIWVAKYEMSMETNGIATDISNDTIGNVLTNSNIKAVSKPGVTSWRYIKIGNCYTNAYNYDRGKESHMMKNSEWGAVAYLTHSKYGRNKIEVTINSNSSYYTGGGSGESYKTNTNQSSTGNVTGIYDLSGGAWENTAAYISNGIADLEKGSSLVGGNTAADLNGYKTKSSKTVTVYPYSSDSDANNYNKYKSLKTGIYGYGDAVLETSTSGRESTSWNSDYSHFPVTLHPFFERGGFYHSYYGASAGMFAFHYNGGSSIVGDRRFPSGTVTLGDLKPFTPFNRQKRKKKKYAKIREDKRK